MKFVNSNGIGVIEINNIINDVMRNKVNYKLTINHLTMNYTQQMTLR